MRDVAQPRGAGCECLDGVDSGRRCRRRNADADQQGGGDDSERHPERAVDQLGGKSDSDERQQLRSGVAKHFRSPSAREAPSGFNDDWVRGVP